MFWRKKREFRAIRPDRSLHAVVRSKILDRRSIARLWITYWTPRQNMEIDAIIRDEIKDRISKSEP